MTEECGADIAEIARRNADNELVSKTSLLHLSVCIEIVECLREETSHIDRVGTCEFHVLIEFCIHKRILHESLAIIKYTLHLYSSNVLTESSELALLNRTYLALWIKHIDVDAIYAKETVGNSRTSITRSSNKNIHLTIAAFLLEKILQQTSHETSTDILESESWSMEQLKRVNAVSNLNSRNVKCQCIVNNVLE